MNASIGRRQRRPLRAGRSVIIVDFQPKFIQQLPDFDFGPMIDVICDRIALAKQRREGIIALEYKNYLDTDTRLTAAIGSYDRFKVRLKETWNGAEKVEQLCKEFHLPTEAMDLVGLFADQCVISTAARILLERYPACQVRILKNAVKAADKAFSWAEYEVRCRYHGVEALVDHERTVAVAGETHENYDSLCASAAGRSSITSTSSVK